MKSVIVNNADLEIPSWLYIDSNRIIHNYYYLIWKDKNIRVRLTIETCRQITQKYKDHKINFFALRAEEPHIFEANCKALDVANAKEVSLDIFIENIEDEYGYRKK